MVLIFMDMNGADIDGYECYSYFIMDLWNLMVLIFLDIYGTSIDGYEWLVTMAQNIVLMVNPHYSDD